ncbi:MAG: restriction endonuclease subunit R [Spirochaetes bacterium GWB1_60_80]|nr:MAG: restriction endonuclease subunit R [Spirochaetes bacterium GWB1_60_80]OHD60253.1 MAG: restriction endonuclease subunit R [Spirochaetes bacterium GWF1_60_12]HAX37593.1 restriction endonuclease subunit R [Spirochaetaceae bacterium]HBO40987.1 restriction endonuclease subunit R [Spirochaetaceae bacterium]
MKATIEMAFEAYIQETLVRGGWNSGSNLEWDKARALFPNQVISFIQATQSDLWAQMEKLHGAELAVKLLETLLKERDAKGTLHIVRHGFKFYGKTFKLAYFKPAHGLVKETLELFAQNQIHATRQVACHPTDSSTVDMVLSLNGIPIATMELKNPATGQTWKHAVAQYKSDRDPRAPLFQFIKGAVVHFAVDPDEVFMATRLNKEKTFFLPFNRGSAPGEIDCGKGNPQHPSGHRTGYFWEDVLERESFLDIVGSFVFLQTSEEIVDDGAGGRKKVTKETMVFPRYHQLDAVRNLVRTARHEQAGNNYLIQHSAGSGKTNSISWLSHRLSSLHTATDAKIFDCVVVITDRRVLDKQLQDAIYQIEHAQGVVKAIDENSRQLSEALIDGTKIVITTLQKFPFILRGLLHIAGADNPDNPDEAAIAKAKEWQEAIAARRYAVIVDEAHSSQTGETARELKRILGAGTDQGTEESELDWEDGLNKVMESRGKQKNLSFFAFTATPKGKTLELFGRKGASGKPEAFHTYSMKQAIEEGFILDVLQRYTTYKTYFKLVKSVEDDPAMPKKKAQKKLGKFMALHPHNIEQKTEIMVEHFREHVKHKLGGRAKAMVVTGSRLHAVRYMLAFQRYIEENNYSDIRPLVAFSGTVTDPETDKEYTEPSMNSDVVTGKTISESQLPDKFDSSDYQVLLVANKYQTGFDQPLLCAMYVDKRLDGVQAVQTLSRLNRTSAGKEPPFVLDFVNESEDIYKAFKPYYNVTTLDEPSDPSHLELLKHELNAFQVYLWSEVVGFCHVFYLPQYQQNPSDHARMEKMVAPAVDRFKALDEVQKESFYEKITAYTSFYSFISQIIPYSDQELEMLYSYCRYLIPHLDLGEDGVNPHPEKEVVLQYYRLEKVMSGSIIMEGGDQYGVKSPTAVGTGKSKDEDKPLSEIIQALNDRFGTDFSEEDRLFFEQIKEKAAKDERIIQTALANPLDKFELGIKAIIESLMMQRMADNDGIVTRYMDDSNFQKTIFPILAREIYSSILQKQE